MTIDVENKYHFGISIFDTVIPNFKEHQAGLVDYALALREQDEGMARSNHGGWHSHDHLHNEKDPEVQWLIKQIYEIGAKCIVHVEKERLKGRVLLSSAWLNINDAGCWNAPHMHLPCEWSGVCYLQVSDEPAKSGNGGHDGDILFFDPLPFGPQYNRNPTVNYTPKAGQIFIFPSYLLHMVAPHQEEQPRISLAFNFRLEQNLNNSGR